MVLPGLLLYPRLNFRLFEPDEGRYAEIPREMIERGEWVVPYLQAEPYLDKPPLLYWLVMGSYKLLGVADCSARLVPALILHACLLMTFFFGRRFVGQRAALWGCLALSLAPGFTTIGRLLVLDGLLTLCTVTGLFSTFEAMRGERIKWIWLIIAGVACGLGVLTKGPIALILIVAPLIVFFGLRREGVRRFVGPTLIFLGIAAIVALPWYVAVCLRIPSFARYFLWVHNVQRFLTPFDHQRPLWFYVPVLLVGFLPISLLLPSFFGFLLSGKSEVAQKRTQEIGFLLLASGWCVLFFSVSGSKLPTYVLPAYPPLALALGAFAAYRFPEGSRILYATTGLAFAVLLIGHHVLMPWYANYRSPMAKAEEVARLCGDPEATLICHPRPCDSVSFYLQRDDLRHYRSKEMEPFVHFLLERPRTVVLFTHRHSLEGFHHFLPANLHVTEVSHQGLGKMAGLSEGFMDQLGALMGETALGLCDIAVVERD
jgi:4-amino-4-deoxy-L-arabinose transferase-like glycosyltransferase